MKIKHLIFIGIFFTILVCGGLVLNANNEVVKDLEHYGKQEPKHESHDDHDDHEGHKGHLDDNHETDDHSKIHTEDKHDQHIDKHEDGDHDEHGHDEESDMLELTKAQKSEIGLLIATARSGDMDHTLSLIGEVRLNEDKMAHLVPTVPGIVRSVSVSLGEKVREGQILAIIDSPDLTELKADYIEKLRTLELSRRTFERKRYLKQEKIASEADWLEAESVFQNAETMLRSAKRRLIFLGMDERAIRNLPDALDEAFGRYELKSPISGTIISKHITRGEKIGDDEVFTVADLSMVWVDLQIPANKLGSVKEGLRVEINATDDQRGEGDLTLIGPLVDRESRTALGRVVLPNPNGDWKPGIFVKGRVGVETTSSTVVVPSEAVQNIEGENIVFAPDGHGFRQVPVSIGNRIKGKTEILSGLKAGDRYVAKGAFGLKSVILTSGADAHAGHGH